MPEPSASPSPGTEYRDYLRIDDLLRLQQPLTPGAHDELLFIVVHQTYELWFRVILDELGAAITALGAARPDGALTPLRRVIAVERVLHDQLGVLETMSPEGFLAFRDPLAPASGFQSDQFREIERLCRAGRGDGALWAAFCTAARAAGHDLPAGTDAAAAERRVAALRRLYHDHGSTATDALLHLTCELLLDHDESIASWRHDHMLMAAREIGTRQGTGGSHGVEYLSRTLEHRFFPELWEVRSRL